MVCRYCYFEKQINSYLKKHLPFSSGSIKSSFKSLTCGIAPPDLPSHGFSGNMPRRIDMARSANATYGRGLTRGIVGLLLALSICWTVTARKVNQSVRNIVLVHGAWADGSGWKGVYEILVKDGFTVTVVQEPETSFQDDVAATKRVLALQDGPCILVAHSYGGAVITEAGNDPSVVGLVYVAAHMPDTGEKESEDGKRFPSDLAKSGAIKKTADGFTYIDPTQFRELFAADVPATQAALMARSQVLNYADNFSATITNAAWRAKPSWMVVAGSDRTINPELERWYAARAKSHKVEVPGASHVVYISHPKEVAAVIKEAAETPGQ
jgi:pimeloyl-ACP methyl ester carboxylesterase